MRYIIVATVLFTATVLILFSCAKWKDPKPVNLHLTNPYCNDPNAANYNLGFPGRPDSTVCIYPSQLFIGTYIYQDTVTSGGLFIFSKTDTLHIYALSELEIAVVGFCGPGDSLFLSEILPANYTINVDTLVDDTGLNHTGTGTAGQILFCRPQDTVSGSFTKDYVDSLLIHVNLTVISDTGVSGHSGSAIKLK